MRILLVAGGPIEEDFAEEYIRINDFDYIIGVDRGNNFLYKAGLVPDEILGDFDSVDPKILEILKNKNIPENKYNSHKDATDIELAIDLAIKRGAGRIDILGATGGRLDHFYGAVASLCEALDAQVKAYIVDSRNRFSLFKNSIIIKKCEQYGMYISIIPFTSKVTAVTLEGFCYPANDRTFYNSRSLGVSNEIVEDEAKVQIGEGIMILIESKDGF